jgi:hypothetical protein
MTQPVTFNDLRHAVHTALAAAFPDIPIMEEAGAPAPPCFLVRLISPEHRHVLGRRYLRIHPFDIQFFAAEPQAEQMYAMAEQLTEVLQHIEAGGRQVRGAKMRFEIVDDVLHFFVEYSFHVWAPKADDPLMGALDVKEGLK